MTALQSETATGTGIKKPVFREYFLFLYGFVLGAVLFFAIYGFRVFNPAENSWIFNVSDPDIRQHYLGWCHYRNAPWSFPFCIVDSLSYPYPVSCLWTDSIPLFAVIFKLFAPILPETFQYLGLYGCLSMALTGGTAALLLKRVTEGYAGEQFIPLLGVFPFVLSFPLFQRMFYHTSLTAHYFILLSLLFWLDKAESRSLKTLCLRWGLLSLVVILIHPYLWAMVSLIAVFSLIEDCYVNRIWYRPAAVCACLAGTAFLGLFAEGAFYGHVSASYGTGGYESNLNTLFNPLGLGRIYSALPLETPTQYEGYGYLGLGMLILTGLSAVLLIFALKKRGTLRGLFRTRPKAVLFAFAALFFFVLACIPHIALGAVKLVHLPLPGLLGKIIGIFRSTGRFIWVSVYILITGAFAVLSRKGKEALVVPAVLICVLIQLFDISGAVGERFKFFHSEFREIPTDFDDPKLMAVMDRYRHFIFTYDDLLFTMDTAYFAYLNRMTLNKFYYARNNDEDVKAELTRSMDAVREGHPAKDVIYLFNEETFKEYKSSVLHFYLIDGKILGTAEAVPGLDELK
ncbi:MAG: DUF6311 domain-containing protein [Lachnospiraceae bacterium]|nr:DUF6311 domain-containing protein [Lachnospiraceae bacterium]